MAYNVTQYDPVDDGDINAIINAINAEENDRGGDDYTDIVTVSSPNETMQAKFLEMIDMNDNINAEHCYCEGDSAIETHNGGVPLSLTADKSDFGECGCNLVCSCQSQGCACDLVKGYPCLDYKAMCACESQGCGCDDVCTCEYQAATKIITATGINKIAVDIDSLDSQCDCDSYACSCESNITCPSQITCPLNCTCQSQGCDCNTRAYKVCINTKSICVCQSQGCGCNYDCICNGVCGCNADCTCDDVCNCEYGG